MLFVIEFTFYGYFIIIANVCQEKVLYTCTHLIPRNNIVIYILRAGQERHHGFYVE